MAKRLQFKDIIIGQQLKIYFKNKKKLKGKTELHSQGTRFVMFGEIEKTKEKILIPAFKESELKDIYPDSSLDLTNFIKWKSNLINKVFGAKLVTPRYFDIKEIYLLDSKGNVKRYDDSDSLESSSIEEYSSSITYDFNDLDLSIFKRKVSDILLFDNKILSINNNNSKIKQGEQIIGVDNYTENSDTSLIISEKLKLFEEKINDIKEIIMIPTYYNKDLDQTLEINEVISQIELLNELNIKTGLNFTREELSNFEFELEIEQNSEKRNLLPITLNFTYKNNKKSIIGIFSSKFLANLKFITKLRLLVNLFSGNNSMLLLKELNFSHNRFENLKLDSIFDKEIEAIVAVKEELVTLIKETKDLSLAIRNSKEQWNKNIQSVNNNNDLTTENKQNQLKIINDTMLNEERQTEKTITENELGKGKLLDDLLTRIKRVNAIQKLSYFQKSLFAENKQYLTEAAFFNKKNNLELNFQRIERYSERYFETDNQETTKTDNELKEILNKDFSEFVKIYQLLPLKLQKNQLLLFITYYHF